MTQESIGAKLKRVRLEKGISLEEAHKKTKLHINVLKAIEEDSVVGINPVYLKGFLKIYSRFLGLESAGQAHAEGMPSIKTKDGRRPLDAPVSLLGPSRINLFNLRLPHPKILIIIGIFIAFITVTFAAGKMTSSAFKARPKTQEANIFLVDKKNKKPVPLSKLNKGRALLSAPIAAADKEKTRRASSIRLSLKAKEDCLVEVKIDGRLTAMRGMLKRGMLETWTAKEKIELSLGNAAAVDVILNGEKFPALGRRGQALRNIVITKEEGLKIR